MTVFYQQSGKRGEVDFVKTLATRDHTLRFFTTADLKRDYDFNLASDSMRSLTVNGISPEVRFQIWGVPSGARDKILKMRPKDIVLLIGQLSRSELGHGEFFYAGRVIYVLPSEDFVLSRKLWGEGSYPLIFFLQGALVDYSWHEFATDFNFAPNYFVYKHTMNLKSERVAASRYGHEEAFAERLGIDRKALRLTHHG